MHFPLCNSKRMSFLSCSNFIFTAAGLQFNEMVSFIYFNANYFKKHRFPFNCRWCLLLFSTQTTPKKNCELNTHLKLQIVCIEFGVFAPFFVHRNDLRENFLYVLIVAICRNWKKRRMWIAFLMSFQRWIFHSHGASLSPYTYVSKAHTYTRNN